MPSKNVIRFRAFRPESFLLSLGSVFYGLYLSGIRDSAVAIATVLCSLLLHSTINIANDYFDYKKKVDFTKSAVNSSEFTSESWYLKTLIILIILSIFIGGYLVYKSDYIILIIGMISIIVAIFYSGGKKPLANMAFGEFLSFFFFGPIACCGTYYLQAGNVRDVQLFNSIAIGLLVSCVMLANNIRDIETDEEAGKLTIAVRIGEKFSIYLYWGLVLGAFCISLYLNNYMTLLSTPMVYFIIKEKNLDKKVFYTMVFTFVYSLTLVL